MSLGIRPCHNDSSTHRYPEEQTVKKQNNNWVRHARAILNEYILNGDFEAICHFWRDSPDFPYNQKEVNVIFAVAKLEFDSYVILDIWDRLGRNPSALKPTALLCVARHLIVMDREDEALLCWKFFADRYEKQGCRYDKNFEEPEEAVEFFRLGLELAQAEDADMFRRCARLLDGFKASANIRDQIRYHVLIGLSGDFVEISRRHPDRREKECTAEVETYVNFIRSCEDLSVSALDDAPFAVPDTEALFLREKWLSGDVDGAVERAVRFMSPYKCPNKEPSNVLEYLDVIWVPPVIRNPPAVSEPLAKTPSEREVLTALLSSWDGQTYRNFLETFKNVKWEGIPPYCCAMVALAAVVAVREDGLGNPETVRTARHFIDCLRLNRKRAKAYAVYGKLAAWFLDNFVEPADVDDVLAKRAAGMALLKELSDGDLAEAEIAVPVEILNSFWSTLLTLHYDCEPFRFEEAKEVFFLCSPDLLDRESNIRHRIVLADKLIRAKEAKDSDVREICETLLDAIQGSNIPDIQIEFFENWLPRRAPSCDPDDFHLEPEEREEIDEALEADCRNLERLAHWNECEVVDWFTIRDGFRAALLRRRNDTGERWVATAHGFPTQSPVFGVRYLVRIGETVDSFRDLTLKKAVTALLKKLVLPEIRSDFNPPDQKPVSLFSLEHFADDGFDKWIQGYDYSGYVGIWPRDFEHAAVVFDGEKEYPFTEEVFDDLSARANEWYARGLLEIIPLLPEEIELFERGISPEDFFALHPDKRFEAFAEEPVKPAARRAAPASGTSGARSPSLRAVRKPARR